MATPFQNFGAFRAAASQQARAAVDSARPHVREGVSAAKNAWKEAGGARGVAGGVSSWARDTAQQYRDIHANKGSIRERIHSDETKATFRHAVGSSINNMLKMRMQRAAKKGGFFSQTLYNFAHMAFQGTMRSLKDDQRTFTNVAKVRRGDPDVGHLTHNELREVLTHAKKYGGKDNEAVHAAAAVELDRRQTQKATEHASYDAKRRSVLEQARAPHVQERAAEKDARRKATQAERAQRQEEYHKEQLRRNDELHKQKLKHQTELRQVAGHGAAAKAATDVAVKRAGAKKTTKSKPAKEKGPLNILKRTKSGGAVVRTAKGGTDNLSAAELTQRQKGRGAKTKGVTPTRRTRR